MSRKTGEGVRLIVKPGAFKPDPEHMALIQKMTRGELTEPDREKFNQLHFKRTCDVLEMPEQELLVITPVQTQIPPRAKLNRPSPAPGAKNT